MGTVRTRKEGVMYIKSLKIKTRLAPLVIINSISLKTLSMSRMIIKTIRPIRKICEISLRT
jgi:hypothetical protein